MNQKILHTALGAIIGIPLIMVGQQALLPRVKQPEVPPTLPLRAFDNSLMLACDRIMDSRQPKAVYYVALRYLQHNDPVSSECWMRYGAMQRRFPSIMLLYGDFCRQQKRYTEARRWLRLAGVYGQKAGAKPFCRIVEQRLKELPPEVRK